MDLGLKNKVALVTGAGSPIGFGRAIALALAKEGCDIISNDINLEDAKQTVAAVKDLGRKAIAIKADVTKSIEVAEMIKTALKEFGRIDILVNNAGATPPMVPFIEQKEKDWDKCINVNLKSQMICAQAVLPNMLERKSGKIVNISSGGAKKCQPPGESYSAAKAGVIAFTRCLALEMIASGINVNAVAPGWALTNLGKENAPPPEVREKMIQMMLAETPIGRATVPQDIANMVTFLASDAASDIVGQTFGVDGGSAP
jgi:3-oxoacyl-[acyl-carrier protein] reductase